MELALAFQASKIRLPASGLLGRIQTAEPGEAVAAAMEVLRRKATPDRPRFEKAAPTATTATLRAFLHPAVPPLALHFAPGGALEGTAQTNHAGPGYHHFVAECLDDLKAALPGEWRVQDPTQYYDERDLQSLKEEFCRWLLALSRKLLDKYPRGGVALALPFPGRPVHDQFLAVPMGLWPREWFDRYVGEAGPRSLARDWFPWWKEKRDAHSWRGLGLCLCWCEAVWERPRGDADRAVLQRASSAFARARAADPDLPLPLAAWAELRYLLGETTPPGFAGQADLPQMGPLGYLRGDMQHPLPGGWSVILPAAFRPEPAPDGTFEARCPAGAFRFDGRAGVRASADPGAGYDALLSDLIARRGKAGRPWERYDPRVEGLAFASDEERDGRQASRLEGTLRAGRRVVQIDCALEAADTEWARRAWNSIRPPAE